MLGALPEDEIIPRSISAKIPATLLDCRSPFCTEMTLVSGKYYDGRAEHTKATGSYGFFRRLMERIKKML